MHARQAAQVVRMVLAGLLCWTLAGALPAQAGGEVRNCSQSGLDAALSGGGLITFNCGGTHAPATILLTHVAGITVATSLDGFNGGHPVTFDGQGNTRLFQVGAGAALTITNLVLTHGAAVDGSCVFVSGALAADHVDVSHCEAGSGHRGGALYVDSPGSAVLSNSNLHDNSAGVSGGAIYSLAALTVTNSTLAHNAATTADGGGIWAIGQTRIDGSTFFSNTAASGFGGGVYNQGTLTATNSVLNANLAAAGAGIQTYLGTTTLQNVTVSGNSGEGLENGQGILTVTDATISGNYYGGLSNQGTLTLTDVTISGNSSPLANGGGIYNDGNAMLVRVSLSSNSASRGGGIANYGDVTLTNVSLSGNSAQNTGGGLDNETGAITLTNATLSGNSAPFGGGLSNGSGGTIALTNDTLSGNSAQFGGGIYNGGLAVLVNVTLSNTVGLTGTAHNLYLQNGASSVLTLTNSIATFGAPGGFNCFNSLFPRLIDGGHNLVSDTSCAISGLQAVDPLLAPLADNGGPRTGVPGDPMLTHQLRPGSLAIDNIPSGANGCGTTLTADQRGAPRPINGKCDIGAVEVGWVYPQLWLPLARR